MPREGKCRAGRLYAHVSSLRRVSSRTVWLNLGFHVYGGLDRIDKQWDFLPLMYLV